MNSNTLYPVVGNKKRCTIALVTNVDKLLAAAWSLMLGAWCLVFVGCQWFTLVVVVGAGVDTEVGVDVGVDNDTNCDNDVPIIIIMM